VSVSAIVLAGGRSSRFGRDKLVEPIGGLPMLWRTIEAVRHVAVDVVVVSAPGATTALPPDVREVHDAVPGEGPLVGVIAGLRAVRHDAVLIVGGDMPWVQDDVLRLMLASMGPGQAAVALESDGRRQQLPIAVARGPALAAGRRLVDAGERRFGALLEALDAVALAEGRWRISDPAGDSLRDVDQVDDLPRA